MITVMFKLLLNVPLDFQTRLDQLRNSEDFSTEEQERLDRLQEQLQLMQLQNLPAQPQQQQQQHTQQLDSDPPPPYSP